MAARRMAFLVVVAAFWLAGLASVSAEPSNSSSPSTSASSSLPASPASSTAATPTGAATSNNPPNAVASPKAAPPLTATFNGLCSDYGFDVTNPTAVPHTVHVVVNGTQAGGAVVVAPGATAHVPLAPNTEPASEVQLVDADGTVISSVVVRFCTSVENISATIAAGTTFTRTGFLSARLVAPSPRHGVATVVGSLTTNTIRYAPDPCFAGTDSFGYDDFVEAVQGVITVTVLPGACGVTVHRSATDCATRTIGYAATNPYGLPAHVIQSNSATPGTTHDLVVPAHGTATISTTFAAPTTRARVTFTVRDTTHTVLTDDVSFPCPALAAQAGPSLAATGPAASQLAGLSVAAIALGGIVTLIARSRRVISRHEPSRRH